jgi:hypothetical protein
MVLTNPTSPTAKALADQLLAEQAVIKRYVEELAALRSRVLAYEEQFGISSSEVHEAIEDGRLQETLEVCDWIMDIEILQWSKSVGQ